MNPKILMRNSQDKLESLNARRNPAFEAGLMWKLPATIGSGIFATEELSFEMNMALEQIINCHYKQNKKKFS